MAPLTIPRDAPQGATNAPRSSQETSAYENFQQGIQNPSRKRKSQPAISPLKRKSKQSAFDNFVSADCGKRQNIRTDESKISNSQAIRDLMNTEEDVNKDLQSRLSELNVLWQAFRCAESERQDIEVKILGPGISPSKLGIEDVSLNLQVVLRHHDAFIKNLRTNYKQLGTLQLSLDKRTNDLKMAMTERDQNRDAHNQTLGQLEGSVKRAEKAENDREQALKDVETFRKKTQNLDNEVRRHNKQVTECSSRAQGLTSEVKDLEHALEEERKASDAARQESRNRSKEVDDLQTTIRNLELDNRREHSHSQDLRRKLNARNQKLRQFQTDINELKDEGRNLQRENDESMRRETAMTEEIKAIKGQKSELEEEVKGLQADNDVLEKTIYRHKTTTKLLVEVVIILKEQNQQSSNTNQELRLQNTRLEADVQKVQHEKAKLYENVERLKGGDRKSQAEIESLIQKVDLERQNSRNRFGRLEDKFKVLQSHEEDLRTDIECLKEQEEILQQQNTELTAELAETEEASEQMIQNLESDVEILERDIRQREVEEQKLKDEIATLEAEFEKEKQSKERTVQSLQQRTRTLRLQVESTEVSLSKTDSMLRATQDLYKASTSDLQEARKALSRRDKDIERLTNDLTIAGAKLDEQDVNAQQEITSLRSQHLEQLYDVLSIENEYPIAVLQLLNLYEEPVDIVDCPHTFPICFERSIFCGGGSISTHHSKRIDQSRAEEHTKDILISIIGLKLHLDQQRSPEILIHRLWHFWRLIETLDHVSAVERVAVFGPLNALLRQLISAPIPSIAIWIAVQICRLTSTWKQEAIVATIDEHALTKSPLLQAAALQLQDPTQNCLDALVDVGKGDFCQSFRCSSNGVKLDVQIFLLEDSTALMAFRLPDEGIVLRFHELRNWSTVIDSNVMVIVSESGWLNLDGKKELVIWESGQPKGKVAWINQHLHH